MLELIDIKKDYQVADEAVHALKGISLKFRKNEFVSILGASGCGKSTLLNIIGGLDQYTSGDLIIKGKSTKEFNDRDWDTYRNHSIGFIFQSYHLIPHQTILQNVELALTISGVPKHERRKRAVEALEKVGLGDKINNRPNQLSGGQAQRVAIARALINDPEILLADEPTGALDSKTSVQIMDLLKEISKDRLVIMVTHNPELAKRYSTRIIRLLDGLVIGDSRPYDGKGEGDRPLTKKEQKALRKQKGKKKNAKMSPLMAFSLSLKNLLSKGKRTTMVSVAGSIGIIGVSMVLAISAGVQAYIHTMEDDMLSGYPVSVTQSALDFSSLMDMNNSSKPDVDITKLNDKVYVNSLMETLGSVASGVTKTNTITDAYLNYVQGISAEQYNVIQYGYDFDIANNIYTDFRVDSNQSYGADGTMSVTAIRGMYTQILREQPEYSTFAGTVSTVATFDEIPDNYEYVLSQYDVLAMDSDGQIVTDADQFTDEQLKAIFNDKQSLIMVVSRQDVPDLVMGQFGYLSQKEFLNYAYAGIEDNELYDPDIGLVGNGKDGTNEHADPENGFNLSKFMGADAKKFTWYPNDEVYMNVKGTYMHKTYTKDNFIVQDLPVTDENGLPVIETDENGMPVIDETTGQPKPKMQPTKLPLSTLGIDANIDTGNEERVDLSVRLLLQKKDDVSYGCLESGYYYTNALTKYVLENSEGSQIVKAINESENGYLDVLPYFFNYANIKTRVNEETKETENVFDENGKVVYEDKYGQGAIYNSGSIMDMLMAGLGGGTDTATEMLRVNARMLGGNSKLPSSLYIYPIDFNAKTDITDYLDEWNQLCEEEGTYTYTDADGVEHSVQLSVTDKITYTDTVGLIINMVNTMIQMITIALIAFTALSLVVSTVMIGIITYVSVVERVKEIGILRAVGARKKDIKRLFNAETFIIGIVAGVIGIAITYLLSVIVNIIVFSLSGVWGIAALPWWQALIMVALSVLLTLISGLIPASSAAKKDPVVALRTE